MSEITASFIIFFLLILGLSRSWRYFWCTSYDILLVRQLEPWFWFIFLNLILSVFSSHFDFSYIPLAALLQLALSSWFAISMKWIVVACYHEHVVSQKVWMNSERTVKFCYRCGTRMPGSVAATELKDSSWQLYFFQMPPHLFEYAIFWVAQSIIFLIILFLALHVLKKNGFKEILAVIAVVLVVGAPAGLYYWNRFKRYLMESRGHVWMDEFKRSFLFWALILVGLFVLLKIG
jgi:hypothetical protein